MLNTQQDILDHLGLSYEDLNPEEKRTYQASNFNPKTLSLDELKEMIEEMMLSVALQLTDTPEGDTANPVLKARLKNYILLLSYLTAPEKAQKAMERAMQSNDKLSKTSL